MNIQTARLILREIEWNDLENIHQLHSYPEVDEYNTLGIPKNIKETKEVMKPAIENQNEKIRTLYCWVVEKKKTKKFIGLAGMNAPANRFKIGEIYYKLIPEFWGNGYATEAAKGLVKFGFETLKLHRVEAGVATKNVQSIKVLEKIGMKNEGIRRKILPIRGK